MIVSVPLEIYSTAEFYARDLEYLRRVDPAYEAEDIAGNLAEEQALLTAALGAAGERSVLDVTCGTGNQTLTLAKLGWQVTGLDLTPAYLELCRERSRALGLAVHLAVHNLTQPLPESLREQFDVVISCMALDNLQSEEALAMALQNMLAALKPGGMAYLRLRDMDFVLDKEDPVSMRSERPVPGGRLLCLEEWLPLADGGIVHRYVYILEDLSRGGYPYSTTVLGHRRLALRKARLISLMAEAGFDCPRLLPQEAGWVPYEAVALKKPRRRT